MALHPREPQGLATAHDAGKGHEAPVVDGRFEILEDLLVLLGVIVRHWGEACAETKMLHDAAEHSRFLLSSVDGLEVPPDMVPDPWLGQRFLQEGIERGQLLRGQFRQGQCQVIGNGTFGVEGTGKRQFMKGIRIDEGLCHRVG